MGNSVRRTPIVGYAESAKRNKHAAHRHLRRKVHALEHDPAAEVYPELREVSNIRFWRKEPRGYDANLPKLLPELMRK